MSKHTKARWCWNLIVISIMVNIKNNWKLHFHSNLINGTFQLDIQIDSSPLQPKCPWARYLFSIVSLTREILRYINRGIIQAKCLSYGFNIYCFFFFFWNIKYQTKILLTCFSLSCHPTKYKQASIEAPYKTNNMNDKNIGLR